MASLASTASARAVTSRSGEAVDKGQPTPEGRARQAARPERWSNPSSRRWRNRLRQAVEAERCARADRDPRRAPAEPRAASRRPAHHAVVKPVVAAPVAARPPVVAPPPSRRTSYRTRSRPRRPPGPSVEYAGDRSGRRRSHRVTGTDRREDRRARDGQPRRGARDERGRRRRRHGDGREGRGPGRSPDGRRRDRRIARGNGRAVRHGVRHGQQDGGRPRGLRRRCGYRAPRSADRSARSEASSSTARPSSRRTEWITTTRSAKAKRSTSVARILVIHERSPRPCSLPDRPRARGLQAHDGPRAGTRTWSSVRWLSHVDAPA